jgi:hypothetical protein
MEHVAAGSESQRFEIQLAFPITPSVVQPCQVGVIGVPPHWPSEETAVLLVREKADALHPIQNRTFMVTQVDRA